MSNTEAFRNPFTPSFGKIPPFMAGREDIVDDILDALDEGPGNPYLSTVFVGARGTGKTALVSYLAQEAGAHGWISVNVSAVPGMLEDIVEQTVKAGSGFVEKPPKTRLEGLTLGPFGASWAAREIEEKMLAETYRDLSAMDQRFLAAMLEDKRESVLSDIAKRMGVTSSYASTYKRRLLEQGVVSERGRNRLAFDIPAFREYLEKQLNDER